MSEGAPGPEEIGARVRLEIDRAIKRNIKGLDFLAAPRQSVGAMPKDVLLRDGTATLYRYRPQVDDVYRVPFLIVSPPSNRGYIFDLAAGQSYVEFMLKAGYDVFLLDWMPPKREEAGLAIDDYVLRFIPDAIACVQKTVGEEEISLAGYCMGGTLAVIYAALFPQGPLKNLICFTTPVDFKHMTMFQVWADESFFDVDHLVDSLGNIPPEIMLGAFDLMRPANRPAGVLHLWTNMWNDEFVKSYRMFDRWAAETLPMPGEYFRQLIKELLWKNALVENSLVIDGRVADLANITAPLLNIVAQHDHVVAHAAAAPLMTRTSSSEREEIVSKGGHVSVVAGPHALKRLWPSIDAWLGKRSV